MASQCVWIVLPNGVSGGLAHFSVAVSLQLDSAAAFAALGNWPGRVSALGSTPILKVNESSFAPTPDTSALRDGSKRIDPNAWNALFPPTTTPVVPFVPMTKWNRQIHSFDAALLSKQVHDAYSEVTQNGPAHPVLSKPAPSGGQLKIAGFLAETSSAASYAGGLFASGLPLTLTSKIQQSLPTAMRTLLPSGYQPLASTPANVGAELVSATVFFNRNSLRTAGVPQAVPPPPTVPAPDFHDAIAQLADQPEVLRALGLILDYSIPVAALSSVYGSGLSLSFVAAIPGISSIAMKTVCTLTANAFYAEPRSDSDLVPGMVPLGNGKYSVDPLDINGALTSLTETAAHAVPVASTLSSDPVALPALRSHGFTVFRQGRDDDFVARMTNALKIQAGAGAVPLHADDLLRGYRLDVSTDGGASWKSLHQRNGKVTVSSTKGAVTLHVPQAVGGEAWGRDEGYVKANAMTTPSDPAAADVVHLHQAICGWSGWSLSVRRPGRAAGDPDAGATVAATNATASGNALNVMQQFAVTAGSLPKLRYGQSYSFRLRTVDLAGNSLPLSTTAASLTAALQGTPYASAAPSLTSPGHVAYRYEPVISPTLLYRRLITEGESLERLVIRSDTDAADGAVGYAGRLNTLAKKSIYHETCERHVAPPKTSQMMAERHGAFDAIIAKYGTANGPARAYNVACKESGTFLDTNLIDPSTGSTGPASGVALYSPAGSGTKLSASRGPTLDHGEYVYYEQPVTLPYLPDPLAVGASFTSASLAWPQQWVTAQPSYLVPDTFESAKPFRLVLADGGAHTTSATVSIDPATQDTTIALPAGTMLTLDYASKIPQSAYAQLAWCNLGKAGQGHFLLTPKRQVTLVHATPKPVYPPSLVPVANSSVASFAASRVAKATYTRFVGAVTVHAPSTASVELKADWKEWDDASGLLVARTARPITLQIAYGDGPRNLDDPQIRHELGDTKARSITYTPIATTRYREYFPPAVTSDSTNITRAGTPITIMVPSTANPPPPKVLYIVPSYKWTPAQDPLTLQRARAGGALRIYFDRPWFVSGEGERVAVICMPATPPNPAPSLLSILGCDPMVQLSAQVDSNGWLPKTSDFPVDNTRITALHDVFLPNGVPVDAVTFPVEYSKERNLFYADIEMPAGAGLMASFAIARYQPNSMSDAQALSLPVRTDFASIAPDRGTTVTRNGDNGFTCVVSGNWVTNSYVPPPWEVPGQTPISDGNDGPDLPQQPTPLPTTPKAAALPKGITIPPKVVYHNQAPYRTSGRVVEVSVESNTGAAPTTPDDVENELGWTSMMMPPPPPPAMAIQKPFVIPLTPQAQNWTGTDATLNDGPTIFKGVIPTFTRAANTRYRLVVREYEIRQTDSDVATTNAAVVYQGTVVPACRALVYTDVFNVT